MINSVRSFIRTMTPTPAQRRNPNKDEGTPDTAAESPVPLDTPGVASAAGVAAAARSRSLETPRAASSSRVQDTDVDNIGNADDKDDHNEYDEYSYAQLFQLLDTQIRLNIGTSVKCGICLSTIQWPTKTPCGHAFCKGCILASLVATPKCPECNTKLTKRGLCHDKNSTHLEPLSKIYKQLLVEFGFTPSIYQASFTTLTQKAKEDGDEDDEDGDGDAANTTAFTSAAALDRFHVAATWQQRALPYLPNTSQIQLQENQMVVQANKEAVKQAGWLIVRKSGTSGHDDDDDDVGGGGDSQPAAASATLLPNTQEILDGAREQQVADYEQLERSLEENNNTDDSQDHASLLLHHHGASEGTTSTSSSRKSVTFQAPATTTAAATATAIPPPPPLPPTLTERGARLPRLEESPPPPPHNNNGNASDNADNDMLPCSPLSPPFRASMLSPIAKIASLSPTTCTGATVANATVEMLDMATEKDQDSDEDKDKDASKPAAAAVSVLPEIAQKQAENTTAREEFLTAQENEPDSSQVADEPAAQESSSSTSSTTMSVPAAAPAKDSTVAAAKNTDDAPAVAPANEESSSSSSSSQPLANTNNNSSNSSRKPNVSGLVEDSFGAMHWTNRLSLTLTPPEDTTDNDTTNTNDDDQRPSSMSLSLTMTMTYDDPQNDYRQKNQQQAALEKGNRDRLELREDEGDDSEDSQETKVREGGRASSEWNAADDDNSASDATAPMTGADEDSSHASTPNSKDGAVVQAAKDDNSPSPPTAVPDSASAAPEATAAARLDRATTPEAAPRTIRRRAQSEPTGNNRAVARAQEDDDSSEATSFLVGDIVNIQSRTWSGINKPGGVARITKVHPNDGSYDVAYILGGRESNVDSVFVSASEETTGKRRRRETVEAALPISLLQALAAQGFDTTGTVTLEQAQQAAAASARQEEDKDNAKADKPSRNRKSNPSSKQKSALKDVSNEQKSSSEGAAPKKRKSNPASDTAKRKRQSKSDDSVPTETKHSSIGKRKSGTIAQEEAPSKKKKTRGSAGGTARSNAPKVPSKVPVPSTAPVLSSHEATQLAVDQYKAHFEAALKEKIIHVVASGLSDVDMDILKALTCKTLEDDVKIKLSDALSKKTTLCVTPLDIDATTNNATTRLRTAKVMRASLAGIPIVSPAWVQLCAERNAPVLPNAEMLAHSLPTKTESIVTSKESDFGVARMAAGVAQKAPLPLHQHCVFFCGDFSGSHRKDLQLMAREAGAKVLSSASAVTPQLGQSRVVLVCHDAPTGNIIPASLVKQVQSLLAEDPSSVLVVNSQWIFESITCAKALPANAFAPGNSKAKALWEASLPQS